MAQNFWTAIWSWSTCFGMTVLLSLLTSRTKTDAELAGLVFGLTDRSVPALTRWYQRPAYLGCLILAAALALNFAFA
jgi:SSS family solute:Na+ symporter